MRRILFSVLTGATLLVSSCTKDEITGAGSALRFSVSDAAFTRGTPIMAAANIPNMGVYAYYTGNGTANNWAAKGSSATPNWMNGTTITNNGAGTGTAVWGYPKPVYWPTATDANISFFAYSPVATTDNGIVVTNTTGTPTLTYTVPTDVTKQPDLMVAVPKHDLNNNMGATVNLSMKHALTCVSFSVAGHGETVTSVKISGVSTTGTLSMDGSVVNWSNLNTPSAATVFSAGVDETVASATLTSLMQGNGYLMMIPQTLAADAKLTITCDNKTVDIPLSGNWIAGQKLNYGITITPEGTIVVTPNTLTIPVSGISGTAYHSVSISCKYADGTDFPTCKWTLTSSDSWLKLSLLPADAASATQTLTGAGSHTIYTYAEANTASDARIATLSSDGNVVVTVTQRADMAPNSTAGSDDILYFKADGTLAVGKWGLPGGPTLPDEVAFFKFGSVVGFRNDDVNGIIWNDNKIVFNPTNQTFVGYAAIPCYTDNDYTNYENTPTFSKWQYYISGSGYHNASNIAVGKGDPCKLAGLTIAEIQAGNIDNGKWRLPILEEGSAFTGQTANTDNYSAHWGDANQDGNRTSYPGGWFPMGSELSRTTFLPALGYRNTNGISSAVKIWGYYLMGVPFKNTNTSSPSNALSFSTNSVRPSISTYVTNGFAVRCVPQ